MSSRISDPHDCSSHPGGDDQLAASLEALAVSVVRDAATTARLDDPVLGAFSAVAGLSHSLVVRHGTAAATALARILAGSGVFQVLARRNHPADGDRRGADGNECRGPPAGGRRAA